MIRRDALREYSRGSLWFLPALAAVGSILLGAVLSRIDVGPGSWLAFQGTADDARSLLITIAGTMVTVIALLLGLAVVALQLSSTQFSPRLLRNFLRDRPNQVVLSVFVGTFAYSAAGLFQVGVSGGKRVDEFPRFAVTVAIALLFLSLALLVFFADHLAHSIQVDYILRVVERGTLRVIRKLPPGIEPAALPAEALAVPAATSGYVQAVRLEELLAAARRYDVHVRLRPRVGEHVVAGTTLAWVWGAAPECELPTAHEFGPLVADAVRIGFERTLEQDPSLGLRQLVDAACKALSPAVNDPYTAIQSVEHLSVIYVALAERHVGTMVSSDPADPAGSATVTIPGRTLPEHLAIGLGLIRRYGSTEPTVIHALLRLLSTLLTVTGQDPAYRRAIEQQAGLLLAAAERDVVEPADLYLVQAESASLRAEIAVLDGASQGEVVDVRDAAVHPKASVQGQA